MRDLNNLRTAAVTVGTTVTPITAAATRRVDARVVYNNGSATVFLGGPTVAVANGLPLLSGASFSYDGSAPLFGIVAAGTVEVRVFEGD